MSNLPAKRTSHITTFKQVSLKDRIPEELLTEYNQRKKALKVTEALITTTLVETAAEAKLGSNNRISLTEVNGGPYARFDFSMTVEGHVVKEATAQAINIDYSTMNLLLNNKILSTSEKRRLLKARGMLPDSILDENNKEEEKS